MRLSKLFGHTASIALIAAYAGGCAGNSPFSLSNLGNKPKTTASAKPAAQTDPSQTKTLAENLDTQLQVAKDARLRGDNAGAIQILSQLMLVAPDDARVVGEYGKTLVAQGRSSEAVQFLKRGTELAPGDASIYSALGVAYDQQNQYAEAKLAYQRALQLKPGDAAALNNFAMSRMLAGDITSANQLIAQAQATGSADPKIARNLALMASLKGSAQPFTPAAPSAATTPLKQVARAPAPVPTAAQSTKKTRVAIVTPAGPAPAPSNTASAPPRALAPKAKPLEVKKADVKKPDATPALRTAAD